MNDVFHKADKHLRDPRERPRDAARAWHEELADDPHPDLYGNGAVLEEFEREVCALLGKSAAVFLPSGIMAQQIALRIWSERTGRASVGMHPRAHLEDKEERAIEVVHGLRAVSLGTRTRLITVEDLESCGERLGSLLLELPQRELGGELPSWADFEAQCDWAGKQGTALHLDGARLWECAAWASYVDICGRFDSIYVSFYKGLDGVAGAMLLGEADFIAEARVWQRRLGGNLIHLWPLVASARRGLRERLPRMPDYVSRARAVAQRFNAHDDVVVRPDEPQTPMFHAFIARDPAKLSAAAEQLATEHGIVLFTRAAATDVPGWSRVEIPCYERALTLDDDDLELGLEKLLEFFPMNRLALLFAALTIACAPPIEPPVCEPSAAPDPFEDPYPRAHFTPDEGWMNDPCGLIDLDDGTHAFFQHNPTGLIWGNLHWGHAVTTDLVTWDQRAPVLEPDDTLGAPFSGTAILDEDDRAGLCGSAPCLILAFTHSGGADLVQKQSLAISADLGATFALYEGNPVLPNPGIVDFRDPRVFLDEDADRFVMVIASGDRARVYHSDDLVAWTEVSAIGPFPSLPEGAYEVSDLFPLDDEAGTERSIFKTDVLPGFAEQGETRYLVGDFDGTTFTPLTEPLVVDHGPDFYAAQYVARSAPPRWMAWLSSWAYALDQPTEPFRGQLTTPRTLALVGAGADARLTQRPDLGGLRDACPLATDAAELADIEGDAFHLVATVDPASDAQLAVFVADGEEVVVGYDAASGSVFVDRTQVGAIVAGFPARFEAPVDVDGPFDLEVVVNRFSIELFADGGRATITASVFPRTSSRGVEARAASGFTAFELTRLRRPARTTP